MPPPKRPLRTGSKKSIAFAPSGRYGREAWRKWTADAVQAAQLDLAGDLLDELVALVVGHLTGEIWEVGHDRVDLVGGPMSETSVRIPCGAPPS